MEDLFPLATHRQRLLDFVEQALAVRVPGFGDDLRFRFPKVWSDEEVLLVELQEHREGVQVRFPQRGPLDPLVKVIFCVHASAAPARKGEVRLGLKELLDGGEVLVEGEILWKESAIFSRSGIALVCETVCIVSRIPPTAQTVVSTTAPGPHLLPEGSLWASPFTNRRGGVLGTVKSKIPSRKVAIIQRDAQGESTPAGFWFLSLLWARGISSKRGASAPHAYSAAPVRGRKAV